MYRRAVADNIPRVSYPYGLIIELPARTRFTAAIVGQLFISHGLTPQLAQDVAIPYWIRDSGPSGVPMCSDLPQTLVLVHRRQ